MEGNTAPLVTVYITSFNYGRFLEQSIESVLNQTMQDFELIIIDDGSTDNSREIIERYRDHPKITPIFQQNRGLNVTNNIALRAARGRYMMRLDADDWLDRHAIEVMSNILERDLDVGLVFPDYYLVDEHGQVFDLVRRHDFDDVKLLDQPAHGACTMIRRTCLLAVGGYSESFSCQDGYDLWIRFIEHFQVRNINLPLFFYRQHGSNLTRNEERILATRAEIIRRHVERQRNPLNVIAVIPVRGTKLDRASEALRPLGGRPLIDWTIEALLQTRRIKAILVTSPDDAVLGHVENRFGSRVMVVRREDRLALPNTSLGETLVHATRRYEAEAGIPVEAVMNLGIENPFRAGRHFDSAIEVMELFNVDSVIGVRPEIDDFYRHDGTSLVALRKSTGLRLEQEEIYRTCGQIHLIRRALLFDERGTASNKIGHVVVDQRAGMALRTRFDWALAESLLAYASVTPASLECLATA